MIFSIKALTKVFISYEKYIFTCSGYNFIGNILKFDMCLIVLVIFNYTYDNQQWYYMKIHEGFKFPRDVFY